MKSHIKTLLTITFLSFLISFSFSQTPGDTTIVKGFNFNSATRDTQIVFPTLNPSEVERIWMKYTIRCKGGVAGYGCGEWDYSCNTYIVDSSRIDSTKAKMDRYFVYPQKTADNKYSTSPTYNYYETEHYDVQINGTTNESSFSNTTNGTETSPVLSSKVQGGKSFVLLSAAQLTNEGLSPGEINALSLFSNGTSSDTHHLLLRIKEVPFSNLEGVSYTNLIGGTEVYHGDWTFTSGENKIPFYQAYNWTGDNLLIEIISSADAATPIDLAGTDVSTKQTLINNANQYARFFTGNYIKVPGYQGITGQTNRTIEAWIKTEGTEVDIMSWGSHNDGGRFTIKVNNNGKIILEVGTGSIVGDQVVNDGNWHHFAITMEGTTLYTTKFYVDGIQLNNIQMNNIVFNTDAANEVEISRGDWNNYFSGAMDDIRIWSATLDAATITNNFNTRVDNQHPNYADLELNYVFNDSSDIIQDLSPHGRNGVFHGGSLFGKRWAKNHSFDFTSSSIVPDITLFRANYDIDTTKTTVYDSIGKSSYFIIENYFDPSGTPFEQDISSNHFSYYPKEHSYFDANENPLSTALSNDIVTLINSSIDYFNRRPSDVEIMSLVTPYGNGLDLGIDGVTWYFDVTDYYPVLKGNKGLKVTRGGEWQEDLDIQFLFVHGTPTREVLDLRQIWKVDKSYYGDITSNKVYEPRTVQLPLNTEAAKIRSAITGHGQQGEFISRQHRLNINNGEHNFNWNVWKQCGENPIHPQGGTWIYDRAGWCPGAPTMIKEWTVTPYINNNQIDVDYNVLGATNDSYYIVNNQIVSYGANNFTNDARIVTVEAPNNLISYGRINPSCFSPVIKVQNNGSNEITSIEVEYMVNNGAAESYIWNGSINFLEEVSITLPNVPSMWDAAIEGNTNKFTATIISVNGGSDEYSQNNSYTSDFETVDILQPKLVLVVKTNSKGFENKYRIEDTQGNLILERNNLANYTSYADTIQLAPGCYQFHIDDSGKNGIDFWANNDGAGYMKLIEINGSTTKTLQPDFGTSYTYGFSVTGTVGLENQVIYAPTYNVSPIPTNDFLNVEIKGNEEGTYSIYNLQGRLMKEGALKELKSSSQINVSNWDAAVYLIHFNTQQQTEVKKFIKN